MNFPSKLELGQIWHFKNSLFEYHAEVILMNDTDYGHLTIIKSLNDPDGLRPVGFMIKVMVPIEHSLYNGQFYFIGMKESLPLQKEIIEYGVNCMKCNTFCEYAEHAVNFKCWSCKN